LTVSLLLACRRPVRGFRVHRSARLAASPRHLKPLFITWAAFSFLFLLAAAQEVRPQDEYTLRQPNRLAPFVPTPQRIVEEMLEVAQVGPSDVVYDLGSGDGRIVITAAQKFGARAVGVEIDEKLARASSQRIAELGLEGRARVLHQDMFETNLRPATVVTLYLLTVVNERLRPILERDLRPGARVVTQEFKIPGWTPEKVVHAESEAGVPYTIYLYVRP